MKALMPLCMTIEFPFTSVSWGCFWSGVGYFGCGKFNDINRDMRRLQENEKRS